MRKALLVAVILGPVALVAILLGRPQLRGHKLELKAYFQDVQGLRAGAPVRVAGVDVGTVTSVRARPENSESPAEVLMLLRTPYELKLPRDAVVSISTAGVLGPAFADISVAGTSGPPAANGSVMRTASNQALTTDELFRRVEQMMERLRCADATAPGATRKDRAGEHTPGHR